MTSENRGKCRLLIEHHDLSDLIGDLTAIRVDGAIGGSYSHINNHESILSTL